jgi:hypothetical protein
MTTRTLPVDVEYPMNLVAPTWDAGYGAGLGDLAGDR